MAYLKCFGAITVPVEANSPTKNRTPLGRARTGAKTGDLLEARKYPGTRWSFDVQTTPMKNDEADSLERLLMGDFHVWDLTGSLTSSGGAGPATAAPSAGTVPAQLLFTGPSPFTGFARAVSGNTTTLKGNLGAAWTVLAVRIEGGVAVGYGFRSTGNYYKNAVLQGAATLPFLAVSGANVLLKGLNDASANANQDVAQVVAVPWLMPAAQLQPLSGWLTRRWPVRVVGDAMSNVVDVAGDFATQQVSGYATAAVGRGKYAPAVLAGAYANNTRALAFTLRQAEQAA